MSLCYSLQIIAADKNMFADPELIGASLTMHLSTDHCMRRRDLTFVHTFASAVTHASTQQTILEIIKSAKDDPIYKEGIDALQSQIRQNGKIALGSLYILKVINTPLANRIDALVQEHPESRSFLVAWSAHQLSKIESELFRARI